MPWARPVFVLQMVAMTGLAAQDSSLIFSTTDPGYRTPGFLGNGAFSLITGPLGTGPTASFAAGLYDAAAGDVPRIAELAAWNAVDVWNGHTWLNRTAPDTAALKDYRQTLDMANGLLETSYRWVDGDRKTSINVE